MSKARLPSGPLGTFPNLGRVYRSPTALRKVEPQKRLAADALTSLAQEGGRGSESLSVPPVMGIQAIPRHRHELLLRADREPHASISRVRAG